MPTSNPTEDHQLLLAEYAHFSESFWKNEELGEKRVNFFITLTTAVLAGIIALYTADPTNIAPVAIQELATGALAITLLIGIVTLVRILWRNLVTDEFKSILHYLRRELRQRSVALDQYELPFRKKKWLFRGGLAEVIALMNSVICTTMAGIWLPRWWLLVGVFMLTFGVQWIFITKRSGKVGKKKEKASLTKPAKSQWFRAGVGAVITNDRGEVLAFERKDVSGAWQLPQGGLDADEEPLGGIYREVEEETGIGKEHLTLLSATPRLLAYELPPEYRSHKTGRGQVQYWYIFRLAADEDVIGLGDNKEFKAWQWMSMTQLAATTVAFRQTVYQDLVSFLAETVQGW